jgi:D-tyrosyl-tRNA(Tyr) deacylase
MVHWPEVALSFDKTAGWLFSADAFGTFGVLQGKLFADEVPFEEEWLPDARRYYANIVGKYGTPVQNVLKKAAKLDIGMILPLHGPVWRENLSWFIGKYDLWSRYQAEDNEAVADRMLRKMIALRIFEDTEGKTNLSLTDVGGSLLLISQFTLYADCKRGNRPGFSYAGKPDLAGPLYEYMIKKAKESVPVVEKGVFGADMKVSLINDGPFTIVLDSAGIM